MIPRMKLPGASIQGRKSTERLAGGLLANGGRAVLRVHRYGYHSDAELASEFEWMRALQEVGIPVPRVIRSRHGRDFEVESAPELDGGRQIDVFEWIDGRQLGSVEGGVGSDCPMLLEDLGRRRVGGPGRRSGPE